MTALRIERINQILETEIFGRKIYYYHEVDSTNDLAIELGKKGEEEGALVIAETQRKGRGRLKRKWFSPPYKNLYLSLLLRPVFPLKSLYPFSFLSCLSLYRVLERRGIEPVLKWPNDVLVREKKIAGTLIEIERGREKGGFLVLGVGINVNMEESDLKGDLMFNATSLFIEKGRYFEREEICGEFLNGLESLYRVFQREGGLTIVRLFEEKAKIKGRFFSIESDGIRIFGFGEGLNEDGALILNLSGELKTFYAGDIVCFSS